MSISQSLSLSVGWRQAVGRLSFFQQGMYDILTIHAWLAIHTYMHQSSASQSLSLSVGRRQAVGRLGFFWQGMYDILLAIHLQEDTIIIIIIIIPIFMPVCGM